MDDATEGQPKVVGGFSRGATTKVRVVSSLPVLASVVWDVRQVEERAASPPPDIQNEKEFPPVGSPGRSSPRRGSKARGESRPASDDSAPEPHREDELVIGTGENNNSALAEAAQLAFVAETSRGPTIRPLAASARKRKCAGRGTPTNAPSGDDGDTESSVTDPVVTTSPTAKRGRGRPLKSGKYAGLSRAKRAMAEAESDAARLVDAREFAAEIAAQEAGAAHVEERRRSSSRSRSSLIDEEDRSNNGQKEVPFDLLTAADLVDRASSGLEDVSKVAATSRNLKGTYVKKLNVAVSSIRQVVENLADRSADGENRRLQAANSRLRAEVEDLQRELRRLRRRLEEREAPAASRCMPPPPPPPPGEPVTRGRGDTPPPQGPGGTRLGGKTRPFLLLPS